MTKKASNPPPKDISSRPPPPPPPPPIRGSDVYLRAEKIWIKSFAKVPVNSKNEIENNLYNDITYTYKFTTPSLT